MKLTVACLLTLFLLAGPITAATVHTVYVGQRLDVAVVDPKAIFTGSEMLVDFTLRVIGKDGFLPSSFDGVQRDGVVNGASGITGSLFHEECDSRFLYDPANTVVIDPMLIGGYAPDPTALTGLFALSGGSYASDWDFAQIVTGSGQVVTVDCTIGHAGETETEFVGFDFFAPIVADANMDGCVNIDDFVLLKNNFGRDDAGWTEGDFNGDGCVNIDDFVLLKNNFGAAPVADAPLPEPASWMFIAVGAFAWRWRRCR